MSTQSSEDEMYQAALAWLWSLVRDPQGKRFLIEKSADRRRQEMVAQLARTADFLSFAGHPERQIPLIHVTGTSGKGSVTTMIAALLRQLGHSVAHHTSPYLQSPREKMNMDGQLISKRRFADQVGKLRTWIERWSAGPGHSRPLKYGEAWVALTYLWLADVAPDWAVVEAGMGGRFDPTRAAPAELAVITNVARDHVQSLGPTLIDIAWHKAGVIRPGKPAVTGVTDQQLLAVLQQEAAEKDAPLYALERDFTFDVDSEGRVTVTAPFKRYENIPVGPAAPYQQRNAAVAVAAVDVLAGGQTDRPFSLADYAFPGRMEIISQKPLIILDGAHNPHKMGALVESLLLLAGNRPKVALVGGIANKEVAETIRPLAQICQRVVVTRPKVPGKPAAPPADVIAQLRKTIPYRTFETAESVEEGLDAILATLPDDGCLIVSGSLYLVGQARERWYPFEN